MTTPATELQEQIVDLFVLTTLTKEEIAEKVGLSLPEVTEIYFGWLKEQGVYPFAFSDEL